MRLTYRIIRGGGLLILGTPVILVLLIYTGFDKADYKSFIETSLNQATGLVITIHGDIGLGYTDRLQLQAAGIDIKSPEQVQIVAADQIGITLSLYDLIKGHWHIEDVTLSGVDFNLEKNSRGIVSLAPGKSEKNIQDETVSSLELPFRKLTVNDSKLSYRDSVNQWGIELNNLNAVLEENNQNATLLLAFDYRLNSGQQGHVDIQTALKRGNKLLLHNLKKQLTLKYGDIHYDLTVSGDVAIDPRVLAIQSRGLKLSSASFELESDIGFSHASDKTEVNMDIETFNLIPITQWLSAKPVNVSSQDLLKISNSALKLVYFNNKLLIDIEALKLGDTQFVGEFSYQPGAIFSKLKIDQLPLDQYLGLISLIPFEAESQSQTRLALDSSLHINRLTYGSAVIEPFINRTMINENGLMTEGQFKALHFKPAEALKKLSSLNPELSSALSDELTDKLHVIAVLEGRGKYLFGDNRLMFADTELQVNDALIKGDFDYHLDKPAIYSNLVINDLDLDKYQGLLSPGTGQQAASDSRQITEILQQLKSIGGKGRIKINKLKYQQVEYRGIEIKFSDV